MAIGWLAVLQAVPWGQVIDNAPKIVTGAKKLWGSVAGGSAAEDVSEPDIHATPGQEKDLERLRQRLHKLEKSTAELHEQMLTSTALIQQLAEQNAQLIEHIEANRVRTLWLTVISGALAVAISAGFGLVLAGVVRVTPGL
ncbi:MAG TPA: hypothetical protein VD810_00830 [Methylophilaceae bacterium]|nr:hypothetical protein [Methylophilaceae bacterium]